MIKEKVVVTPGGAFEEGLVVIKKLRALAKYFGTGQRKQKLLDIQQRYSLLEGFPQLDGLTCVASCHKLFQTTILHHFALE
jgi:hypothetical protein